ncbi:hypothetical protein MesoLj113a_18110 [Mesorhizobium sp. 113-1-2]|uniref:hypothetical protein n=1 Tax=Mesorhizobium sp. 113-1-2 TaxID=2744515 RepID=UPI000819A388|nr:hypothetical protein [Mesorhizobium sp. 113-1-2]BAV47513.1 Putative uncharacterized protein [Mesorhizobium loti]BCG70653.1 hypothetical protein MesoLj113a_18110 [Mesorhizobium sp. 113-1-2]
MRKLPFDIDADAVIEVGRYLDDHAKTTAVSISEALRVIRRRVNNSRIGDIGLEELIVESAVTRKLAILLDNHN